MAARTIRRLGFVSPLLLALVSQPPMLGAQGRGDREGRRANATKSYIKSLK